MEVCCLTKLGNTHDIRYLHSICLEHCKGNYMHDLYAVSYSPLICQYDITSADTGSFFHLNCLKFKWHTTILILQMLFLSLQLCYYVAHNRTNFCTRCLYVLMIVQKKTHSTCEISDIYIQIYIDIYIFSFLI